jgi:hypothetical protein
MDALMDGVVEILFSETPYRMSRLEGVLNVKLSFCLVVSRLSMWNECSGG